KLVRSADDVGIELAARGVPKLRRKLVRDQRELADCVVGDVKQRASERLRVVVDALNHKIVVARTLSANRGATPMPIPPVDATLGLSSETFNTPWPCVAEGSSAS